ncbi:hypothetical protein AMTR_s00014p00161590 [Amborella trichopoda]|uniref:Uncharacterized protein n=1 Tax=Amborella trichopoda TaxID=13333 RepID=W1PN42_AMBTC|nr:hypothetical protein AMTR_s00014p00161590 [Amborella trichopoda]
MPLVQEISSASEETATVSPSQVDDASPTKLVGELILTPSVSPRSVSRPFPMAEVNLIVNEAADEGITTIQGDELGVEEASEEHEAVADDGGSRPIGGEESIPIRDEDIDSEGLDASQEEGPDVKSEQPTEISPDDLDGGVKDEGLNIA